MVGQPALFVGREVAKITLPAHVDAAIVAHLDRSHDGAVVERVQAPVVAVEFQQAVVVGEVHDAPIVVRDVPVLSACLIILFGKMADGRCAEVEVLADEQAWQNSKRQHEEP